MILDHIRNENGELLLFRNSKVQPRRWRSKWTQLLLEPSDERLGEAQTSRAPTSNLSKSMVKARMKNLVSNTVLGVIGQPRFFALRVDDFNNL